MALRRFLLATTFLTFILLVVGGTVNPTGSSLACPDWPTCFGSFFPEMKNGVEYEHTHRVVATLVGFFTLIFAFCCIRSTYLPKSMKTGAVIALLLVIIQGVLGGITVIYKLPTLVSTTHLALSMGFFCFLIYSVFNFYRTPTPTKSPTATAFLATSVVYFQIILGALVRHTNSARTCGLDPLLCMGELWPTWGPQKLHMTHRFFAIVAFVFTIWASAKTYFHAKKTNNQLAKLLAIVTPYVAFFQVILGIITVQTGIGVVPVTAHLGMGALMLAGMWAQYLSLKTNALDPLKTNSLKAQMTV